MYVCMYVCMYTAGYANDVTLVKVTTLILVHPWDAQPSPVMFVLMRAHLLVVEASFVHCVEHSLPSYFIRAAITKS